MKVSCDDYTFKGWYTDAGCTDVNKYDFTQILTGKVDLYAKWEEKAVVTFDTKGGSNIPQQKVEKGKNAVRPADPTNEGYDFDGWYTDPECTDGNNYFNQPQPITANTTLYAKWKARKYTVTFDANGGSPTPDQQVVEYNKTVDKPEDPKKEGCTFKGWMTDGGDEFDFVNEHITKNTTLFAKWEENEFTVTFNANGGKPSLVTRKVKYNYPVEKPADPIMEGYYVEKWVKTQDGDEEFKFDQELITGDTTLYAKWKAEEYTVTFDSDGGSAVAAQSISYNGKAAEPTPAPDKNGYKFDGWYLGNEKYDFNTPVKANITLKAHWIENGGGNSGGGDAGGGNAGGGDAGGGNSGSVSGNGSGSATVSGDKYIPFDKTGKILQVAIIKRTDDSMTISWNKIPGADGYLIYGHKCYSSNVSYITDITDPDTLKFTQGSLNKDCYYKYQIRAYKNNGKKKKVFTKSLRVHGTTTSEKYTVAADVKIDSVEGGEFSQVSGNCITLKKGETAKIKATEVLEESGKSIEHKHRNEKQRVTWQTNDPTIARVSKSGKVKAKNTGECMIYGVAQNGMLSPVKIVVK